MEVSMFSVSKFSRLPYSTIFPKQELSTFHRLSLEDNRKTNRVFQQHRYFSSETPKTSRVINFLDKLESTKNRVYTKAKNFANDAKEKSEFRFFDWVVFSVILGGIGTFTEKQKKELEETKKQDNIIDAVIIEALITIEELMAFPRIHLYEDFDSAKVQSNLSKIENIITKIESLNSDPKPLTLLFLGTVITLQKNIEHQIQVLKISRSLLKAALHYNKREFSLAKNELECLRSRLEAWAELFIGNKDGQADKFQKEQRLQMQSLLTASYNMYGIVLRANAKMGNREKHLTEAAEQFLKSLRIAMYVDRINAKTRYLEFLSDHILSENVWDEILTTPQSEIESTHPLEPKEIDSRLTFWLEEFCVHSALGDIKENNDYSAILSNIGFLLNQWGKPTIALRFHKAAYDLTPRKIAIVNGLAYGFTQMGIFNPYKDPVLKEECYIEGERFFNIALSFAPDNRIVTSNLAQFFLERAEEDNDSSRKREFYQKARNLLKPLVESGSSITSIENKKKCKPATYILYAVALSNSGDLENAKYFMQQARVKSHDDIRLRPYIDDCLRKDGPYILPAVDSNRTVRKEYPGRPKIVTTPFEKEKKNLNIEGFYFDENNVKETYIETTRTIIRPIRIEDRMFVWEKLYGNGITMTQYHNRKPRELKTVSDDIKKWCKLFDQNQPYSAYIVESNSYSDTKKGKKASCLNATNEKIGLVVIEASNNPTDESGLCEIFYLFSPDYWGDAYGKEALDAFYHKLVEEKLMKNPRFPVQGKLFEEVELSTLPSNIPSKEIIEDIIEAKKLKEEQRHEGLRLIYRRKVET